jgi:S-adenosylmethionine synthetase
LYTDLQKHDSRWVRDWKEIQLLINPNGPLVAGGSDGDNGQTGRKLVVDYYGPRVPIGGGALSGKDLTHIDRSAAYASRKEAIRTVKAGAKECRITLIYAPNHSEPLDVQFDITGNPGLKPDTGAFDHRRLVKGVEECRNVHLLGQGTHFYDGSLNWNCPD